MAEKLTEEEKVARQVKAIENAYRDGPGGYKRLNTILGELDDWLKHWQEDRVKAIKKEDLIHGDFPRELMEPRFLVRLINEEMVRRGYPWARAVGITADSLPSLEKRYEPNLDLLVAELPEQRMERLESQQAEAEVEQAALEAEQLKKDYVLGALTPCLSENFWPEDDAAIHYMIRWIREKHDVIVSEDTIKGVLKGLGYFDPFVSRGGV